ncbi:MAG TPA: hypothetical protein VFL91_18500 [Thermomicrobiales bacterium]|nr:hypothetical protein [Thermomicrobiales bacterium]
MTTIPPFRLIPEPLTDEARQTMGFKWAGGDIGKRHRLGGEPQFIQDEETPMCPSCRQRMTFYGQLDSIGDDYNIADCGVIYVFLCFDCFTAQALVQSA